MPNIIAELEKEQLDQLAAKAKLPDFTHGDTVKVWVKVREGEKERLQAYEGVVIARAGSGLNESFTVRKISYGEGVERVFPVLSPNVDRVEVMKRGAPCRGGRSRRPPPAVSRRGTRAPRLRRRKSCAP